VGIAVPLDHRPWEATPDPRLRYPPVMPEGAENRDLKRIWLFSGCTQAELRRIQKVLKEVTVPTGRLLVEEGQPGLMFFIVVTGRATVKRGENEIASIGPGDYFGELSLLDEKPRSASVVCETDMTLLVLMQRHFQKILRGSPSMAHKILKTMGNRLRDSDAMAYE
jgi:CRP/FNR family cyclic AMP-dependent transcriptional regulator